MKITFTRSCITDAGKRYISPIMSVTYLRYTHEAGAIRDAIRTFEEHMKVDNWREVAHDCVVC